MLATLVGLINAVGFLALCDACLGAPEASTTVLGASLPEAYAIAQFVAGMAGSFVVGIVFTTLITYRSDQYRRTAALACTAIALIAADLTFRSQIAIIPAVFLAMAMGCALCILERGDVDRRLAMSPSAPNAWFGQGWGSKRFGGNHRQTGAASFWQAFLTGGLAGAGLWLALDIRSFALAVFVAGLLTMRTWLIERDLLAA